MGQSIWFPLGGIVVGVPACLKSSQDGAQELLGLHVKQPGLGLPTSERNPNRAQTPTDVLGPWAPHTSLSLLSISLQHGLLWAVCKIDAEKIKYLGPGMKGESCQMVSESLTS